MSETSIIVATATTDLSGDIISNPSQLSTEVIVETTDGELQRAIATKNIEGDVVSEASDISTECVVETSGGDLQRALKVYNLSSNGGGGGLSDGTFTWGEPVNINYTDTQGDNFPLTMCFNPVLNKFVGFGANRMYTSTDATSWSHSAIDTNVGFECCCCTPNGTVYSGTLTADKLYKTSDGETGELITVSGVPASILKIYAIDDNTLMACDIDGIYKIDLSTNTASSYAYYVESALVQDSDGTIYGWDTENVLKYDADNDEWTVNAFNEELEIDGYTIEGYPYQIAVLDGKIVLFDFGWKEVDGEDRYAFLYWVSEDAGETWTAHINENLPADSSFVTLGYCGTNGILFVSTTVGDIFKTTDCVNWTSETLIPEGASENGWGNFCYGNGCWCALYDFVFYSVTGKIVGKQTTIVNDDISITANGTYYPSSQYTGFGIVDVNVPVNATKFGASVGAFLGDVNSSGVLQKPSEEPDVVFTGVKDVGELALAYAFGLGNNATRVKAKTIQFPDLTAVSGLNALQYLCNYSSALTSVSFPKLVTISGANAMQGAFSNCTNLTSVSFPELTTISTSGGFTSALSSCRNLTSISFPKLTTLGAYSSQSVFTSCTSLTSVSFPELTTLDNSSSQYMFNGCTALTSIAFPKLSSLATSCMMYMFQGCTSLASISFPALTSTSFGNTQPKTNCMQNMLRNVTGCTVHFPSNLQSVIGSESILTDGFGGTNTTVLFDLTATE